MMTRGAANPLQSTGGRHTTLGRLHRHTAFTQLPYGIATECRLRSTGLLPEYQKNKGFWRVFPIKSIVVRTVLRATVSPLRGGRQGTRLWTDTEEHTELCRQISPKETLNEPPHLGSPLCLNGSTLVSMTLALLVVLCLILTSVNWS